MATSERRFFITHGDTNFLTFGPPGTGKTTYLKSQVERAETAYGPERVLVCSFTRAAAAEIGSRIRLPKRNVGTLHSICYHALDSPELTEGNEKDFNERYPAFHLTVREKRGEVDHADDTFDSESGTKGDQLRAEIDMLRVRRIPPSEWSDHHRPFHAAWTDWKRNAGLFDFTDLLEKCLDDFPTAPANPSAIFFDEAQDASKLQADLLAQWGEQAQRLILAGDDDQAIFFWAGADYRSFIDFPCAIGNRRYLEKSYRVPRAVHRFAEKWIKLLSRREQKIYKPRDADGWIETFGASWFQPEAVIDETERLAAAGQTVMIEATCSYMLEPVKAILRRRGLPFHNPWRKKRGDWNPLATGGDKKTLPLDRLFSFLRPAPALWGKEAGIWQRHDVWAWASVMAAKGQLIHGAKEKLKEWKKDFRPIETTNLLFILQEFLFNQFDKMSFGQREECSAAISTWLECLPEKEKVKYTYLQRVFNIGGAKALVEKPKIAIGTGHSLKGAEADVCFIFPDPSLAGWNSWIQGGDNHDGIIRLFYVMLTRAREGVYLCAPHRQMYVDLKAILEDL